MTGAANQMKHAANAKAWAIGAQGRHGFHVRRIVWGLLLAWYERRDGEEIRAATILVERQHKRRKDLARDGHTGKAA